MSWDYEYQHQNDVKNGKKTNAFFVHLETHDIRWQEVVYLENEEDWKKRKIKEALIINAMEPTQIMNLEKGMEIYQCWNEFNPNIRNIVQKKEKSNTSFGDFQCMYDLLHFHNGS